MERFRTLIKNTSWRLKILIPIFLSLIVLPITFQNQIKEKLPNTAVGHWIDEKGFAWLEKIHDWDEQSSYASLLPLDLDENGNPTQENSAFRIWLHSVLSGL